MKSDNPRMRPWRHDVAQVASLERPTLLTAAVGIRILFVLQRPKSAPKARTAPTVKPDIDKLVRAIFDALKGICWLDDAQVVKLATDKEYGLPSRCEISVWGIGDQPAADRCEWKVSALCTGVGKSPRGVDGRLACDRCSQVMGLVPTCQWGLSKVCTGLGTVDMGVAGPPACHACARVHHKLEPATR